MANVQFFYGQQSGYNSAVKVEDALYFITDTQRIYKGSTLIVQTNVVFTTTEPQFDTSETGYLYVYTDTSGSTTILTKGENSMETVGGGEATSVADGVLTVSNFEPGVVVSELGDSPTDNQIPTAQAVKEYVDNIQSTLESSISSVSNVANSAFIGVSVGPSETEGKFALNFTRTTGSPVTVELDKEQYLLDATVEEREAGDPPTMQQCLVLEVQVLDGQGSTTSREVVLPLGDIVQVDASTVNTTSSIVVTTTVGNYTAGTTITPTNLQQILLNMLSEDRWMGVAKNPSMGGSLSPSAASAEVGTALTPSYNNTFVQGSYANDSGSLATQPSPNNPVTSWTASFTGQDNQTGGTETSFTGDFTETVYETTTKTLQVTCNYGIAANGPLTFLGASEFDGTDSDDHKIPAGNVSQTRNFTGYYQGYFIGSTTDTNPITSATIRGLTLKKNSGYSAGTATYTVPAGAARVVIACPASATGVTQVINQSALNADITDVFTKSQVQVEGANSYTAINYNVWSFTPPAPYEQPATLAITLG